MLAGSGLALFVVAVLVVHAAQPQLDAGEVAISYYMNGRFGWVLGAGLVALGAASLVLAQVVSRRDMAGTRRGRIALAVWGAGAIMGGLFAPDAMGRWSEPPTIPGAIHNYSAMIAFLAFPFAALTLSGPIGRMVAHPRSGAALRAIAVATCVTLVIFFLCLAPAFANRAPVMVGLVERILLALHVTWLALVTLLLWRSGAREPG